MLIPKSISRDKFTVQIMPNKKAVALSLSINENGFLQLNRNLADSIKGIGLNLFFTEDGKHLLLEKAENEDEASVKFAKSGRRKISDAADFLKDKNASFPVRFSVWKNENDAWQGDIQENPILRLSGKVRQKRS